MDDFFVEFPELGQRCAENLAYISARLESAGVCGSAPGLSIDTLLPYFFADIPGEVKRDMSLALSFYREIVDRYNRDIEDASVLPALLSQFYAGRVVSRQHYHQLTATCREYQNGDILGSYLYSTSRVFYRRDIFADRLKPFERERKEELLAIVDRLSAFFLFDDDVCDYDRDLATGKRTILTQYVTSAEGGLDEGMRVFRGLLNQMSTQGRNSPVLVSFVNRFRRIYL